MTEEKKEVLDQDIEKTKTMAMISYFWIASIYVYLFKKKSKFSQFHSKQGVVLFLLSFATVVPGFGQLLSLVIMFAMVWGAIKAYNGEWFKLPFVYDLSKKVKF
ncbi:hypothetical protein C0584_05885 [Candidatus Parcubacteria bacterium]|nr:MAG: hypothetical protein C0584_05885 [Candidatus Parcubacteria bacterium]